MFIFTLTLCFGRSNSDILYCLSKVKLSTDRDTEDGVILSYFNSIIVVKIKEVYTYMCVLNIQIHSYGIVWGTSRQYCIQVHANEHFHCRYKPPHQVPDTCSVYKTRMEVITWHSVRTQQNTTEHQFNVFNCK